MDYSSLGSLTHPKDREEICTTYNEGLFIHLCRVARKRPYGFSVESIF